MEKDISRLELSGFVSRPNSSQARQQRSRELYMRRVGAASSADFRPKRGSAYLLIRLGVCLLLFCGVLALKLSSDERSGAALAVISSALGDPENDPEQDPERLGRLRFVKIPSIIEVFAPNARPSLPEDAVSVASIEEGTVLRVSVPAGSDVAAPCAGVVRVTGSDETYGAYAALTVSEDTEILIMGLGGVTVENGQPLSRTGLIGKAPQDGMLYYKVLKNGRPVDAAEYFGVGSMQ